MNFHSMTSLCLFNRGTNFSQAVTHKVLFATFPKIDNFCVLIRPVTFGWQKGEAPLNIFSPFLEKCVGHSLKIWAPPRKLFAPSGVPSWLRAWF